MRALFQYIHAPAPPSVASLASIAMLTVGGLYCVVWGVFLDEFVSWHEALAWAGITFLPWYAAFEANKRLLARVPGARRRALSIGAVLLAALMMAAFMERGLFAAYGYSLPIFSLHLFRHLPETVVVALLSIVAALLSPEPAAPGAANDRELPVAPDRIRWIKSAGNYVEIATPARVEMHRMTLAEAERLLDPRAFARVNRTTIVARALIVRVKPGAKAGLIELQDGRAVPIGQAYRANFADAA